MGFSTGTRYLPRFDILSHVGFFLSILSITAATDKRGTRLNVHILREFLVNARTLSQHGAVGWVLGAH